MFETFNFIGTINLYRIVNAQTTNNITTKFDDQIIFSKYEHEKL